MSQTFYQRHRKHGEGNLVYSLGFAFGREAWACLGKWTSKKPASQILSVSRTVHFQTAWCAETFAPLTASPFLLLSLQFYTAGTSIIHWHCSTFPLKSRWMSLWSLWWRIRSAESRNLQCHVCPRIVTDFRRTHTGTHMHILNTRKIAGKGHVAIRSLASWHDAFNEPWLVWIAQSLFVACRTANRSCF